MRATQRRWVAVVVAGALALSACESRAAKATQKTASAARQALTKTLTAVSWRAVVEYADQQGTFEVQQSPVPRVRLSGTAKGRPYETFLDDDAYVTTDPDRPGFFIGFLRPCPGRTRNATTVITGQVMSLDLASSAKQYAEAAGGYDAVLGGNTGRIHLATGDGYVQSVRFFGTAEGVATSVTFSAIGTLPAIELPAADRIAYPALGSPTVPADQRSTFEFLGLLANCR